MVDVEHATTHASQTVVVRGDAIVAVGKDAELARAWTAPQQIDGRGRYLIPGLWDMHVHFGGGPALVEENKALLPLYIAHGITTIRDCSGDLPTQVLQWRDEIADGRLEGPRLFTSGAKIEGIKPVWKGTIEVGNNDDLDAAFRKLRADRVDFVKITDSTLTPEDINATRRINTVVMRGHVYDRKALDALLERTRSKVATWRGAEAP